MTQQQQPWTQHPQRVGFWRQLWTAPWPIRALVGIVVALLVAVVVLAIVRGPSSPSPANKAQYDQWRSECEARATETLDTSLYQVGGNHWVDAVNRCLVAKAGD